MSFIKYIEENKERLFKEFTTMTGKYEDEDIPELFDWNELKTFIRNVIDIEYPLRKEDIQELEKVLTEKYGYIKKEFPRVEDAKILYLSEIFDEERKKLYE